MFYLNLILLLDEADMINFQLFLIFNLKALKLVLAGKK